MPNVEDCIREKKLSLAVIIDPHTVGNFRSVLDAVIRPFIIYKSVRAPVKRKSPSSRGDENKQQSFAWLKSC